MAVTVIDGQHGNPDVFRSLPVACEGNEVGVVWVQGRAHQNGSMQFDFRKEFFFESFHQHQIKRLQIEFWQQFLQRGFARVFWQFRNQGMAPAGRNQHLFRARMAQFIAVLAWQIGGKRAIPREFGNGRVCQPCAQSDAGSRSAESAVATKETVASLRIHAQ